MDFVITVVILQTAIVIWMMCANIFDYSVAKWTIGQVILGLIAFMGLALYRHLII